MSFEIKSGEDTNIVRLWTDNENGVEGEVVRLDDGRRTVIEGSLDSRMELQMKIAAVV